MELIAVQKVIEDKIGSSDKFLVDLTLNATSKKIQVLIDGDQGVSIDDCVALSREIRDTFEEALDDYNLEVSSAGIGYPLTHVRQYLKNTGKMLEIITSDDEKLIGEVVSVDIENGIVLKVGVKKGSKNKSKTEEEEVELPYFKIKSAKVILSFK